MNWRPWVVAAALFAAFMFNAVLVFQERLPKIKGGQEVEVVDEVLRHMTYLPTTRRSNFKLMGMDEDLADKTAKQVDRYARKEKAFKQLLDEQATTVGVAFCPGMDLPQPYAAMMFLVKEENEMRDVLDPERLQEFEEQEWFVSAPVRAIYSHFELTAGRYQDATLMGVSAVLMQREEDALDGYAPFSTGLLGNRGWGSLKKEHPRAEITVIQYFSLMHYLTELANARKGICS